MEQAPARLRYYDTITLRDDHPLPPELSSAARYTIYGGQAEHFVERFISFFVAGSVQQGCLLLANHHQNTVFFRKLVELDAICPGPTSG